jgi:hypothetical protein
MFNRAVNQLKLAAMTLALVATARTASAQLVGSGSGANCFPFGCSLGSGTVYQQVYAASNFGGAVAITGLRFFREHDGELRTGTFEFYLSTTTASVDGLSNAYDNNRGVDNVRWGTFALGGGAPGTLDFVGSPFYYDPSAGNLLLDIRVTDGWGGSTMFRANNGDAGGMFSRAHDFGAGTSGYGLQTEFVTSNDDVDQLVAVVPEPATTALVALGLVAMVAMGSRRRS